MGQLKSLTSGTELPFRNTKILSAAHIKFHTLQIYGNTVNTGKAVRSFYSRRNEKMVAESAPLSGKTQAVPDP